MKRLVLLLTICLISMTSLMGLPSLAKGKSISPRTAAAKPYDVTYTFSITNNTGYDIKKLYLAPSSSADWVEDDELLKGRLFGNGAVINITYTTGKNADAWDLRCGWTDGSKDSIWNGLNLNGASNFTMTYDKGSDTTSIHRD